MLAAMDESTSLAVRVQVLSLYAEALIATGETYLAVSTLDQLRTFLSPNEVWWQKSQKNTTWRKFFLL